jgi:8-oxo-dGTP pyrophosphatase MutT (NUDIX family)
MTLATGTNGGWHPHVTVASIARRDGKYLMVMERHQGKCVINQPAGHLERGESLEQAVVRETMEETGWEFTPLYLSGIYQFEASNGETYLRFTFSGELKECREDAELDPAIEEVLWLDREMLELKSDTLRSKVVLECINDFESGTRLPEHTVKRLE